MKFWFEDSGEGKTAKLISVLLSKRPGNFLCQEKLQNWETSRLARSDPYALPETLGELYRCCFQRSHNRREQFKQFKHLKLAAILDSLGNVSQF